MADEPLYMDLVRLEAFREPVRVKAGPRRDSVIADHGGSEGQDLSRVRRVGERLGVPDHPGREHELPAAQRGVGGAGRRARELLAGREGQEGRDGRSLGRVL